MPNVCVDPAMNNAKPTIMSEVCHILCQQLQTNASVPSTASIFMSPTIHIHDTLPSKTVQSM